MRLVLKALQVLAVALGVVGVYFALGVVAHRWSLWDLSLVALVVLPVSLWRGRAFGRRCAAFAMAACVLAASPVDVVFTLQRGPGIRFAEASYGIACSSEACYGCSPPLYRARWALVVAL